MGKQYYVYILASKKMELYI